MNGCVWFLLCCEVLHDLTLLCCLCFHCSNLVCKTVSVLVVSLSLCFYWQSVCLCGAYHVFMQDLISAYINIGRYKVLHWNGQCTFIYTLCDLSVLYIGLSHAVCDVCMLMSLGTCWLLFTSHVTCVLMFFASCDCIFCLCCNSLSFLSALGIRVKSPACTLQSCAPTSKHEQPSHGLLRYVVDAQEYAVHCPTPQYCYQLLWTSVFLS